MADIEQQSIIEGGVDSLSGRVTYPKLYKANETDFSHNGLGLLVDSISAVPIEELNGMFEIKIEYDSEGFLADEIKEEMIIKAKANDKQDEQLFRIYSITKNHESDNLVIDAQHITYDLANDFVEELIADNLSKKRVMEQILANSVGNSKNKFIMTSPNNSTRSSTKLYRTNPLQMVGGTQGSVLQIWGGQIERDNYRLVLHDRRGSDDGVTVSYAKNITGLEAKFDMSKVVTRIYPFKYVEESDEGPERLITIGDANGGNDYIDSPLIDNYEQIYIEPYDLSDKESIETSQDLYDLSKDFFKKQSKPDRPKVEMEVNFETLWETEEYKDVAPLELVGMGDTVTIHHSVLNVDIQANVNLIEFDSLTRKNKTVELGDVKAKLTDKVNRVDDMEDKVTDANNKADQAIVSADGKNTNYYGPNEPENPKKGDLWFRVVDGEYTRTYRFDGIEWKLIIDMDSNEAKETANEAKESAQGAVDKANEAVENAQGAFDEAKKNATELDDLALKILGSNNIFPHDEDKWEMINPGFYATYDLFPIEPNQEYTLTDFSDSELEEISLDFFGEEHEVVEYDAVYIEADGKETFTTPNDVHFVGANIWGNFLDGFPIGEDIKVQLEKGKGSSSWTVDAGGYEGELTTITATVEGLQIQVKDNEDNVSTVTQLAESLVSQFEDLSSDVSSQISQMADNINLRVEKDDIINQINISEEDILISGKKLILDGDTTVNGSFKVDDSNIKRLDAGKITFGTLDGAQASIVNLNANNIISGEIDAKHIRVKNLDADEIDSGTIDTDQITIRGGNDNRFTLIQGDVFTSYRRHEDNPQLRDYTEIKNGRIEVRGNHKRIWKDHEETSDVSLRLEEGQFRARNNSRDWSVYYNDWGISTFKDGTGDVADETASGSIEFHSTKYHESRGLTIFAGSVLALETNGGELFLNPNGSRVQVADEHYNHYPILAARFSQQSSKKQKRDIKPLQDNPLDLINSLEIKEYKRLTRGKKTIMDRWQVGLILEESPRQLLSDGDSIDLYSYVSYTAGAVQSLSKKVNENVTLYEELKNENKSLKKRVKHLEDKLEVA